MQNAYIRPRWAAWLGELSALGLDAGTLQRDPANRDTQPRDALAAYREGQRTVTPAKAYDVGKRLAADPRFASCADPCIALYAAGYLSIAATCLELTIDDALARYPNRAKVEHHGMIDEGHAVVRQLRYALVAAVALPYALAHLDEIDNATISSQTRADFLARVTGRSEPRFFDAWPAYIERQTVTLADAPGLTLADAEALAWTGLVNWASRRARSDPILQMHFSVLRTIADEYQEIAFAVPHFKPQ
jgi:hypothetical protein